MIPKGCEPKEWWREMYRKAVVRADYAVGKEWLRYSRLTINIMIRLTRKGYKLVNNGKS